MFSSSSRTKLGESQVTILSLHTEDIAILNMEIVSSNYCSCALQEKPWDLPNACEVNVLAMLHYSSGNINRNFLDT